MPPLPPSYPLYAGLCGGATLSLLGTYFYRLTAPSRNYQFSYHATPGHEDSLAFTLLNPRRFPTEQDCFSLWIAKADLRGAPGMSNEEIVARFTRGFFGGWVFAPERWFFWLTGVSLADDNALNAISPVNLTNKIVQRDGHTRPANKFQIWTPAALSPTTPPPLGALLFGNFLVFDSCGAATQRDREVLFPTATTTRKHIPAPDGVACVEVVGGPSRTFGLLPSHRFEVTGEGEGVRVTLSHVRCDPYVGGRFGACLRGVHLVYARLLFADGVREVVRAGDCLSLVQ